METGTMKSWVCPTCRTPITLRTEWVQSPWGEEPWETTVFDPHYDCGSRFHKVAMELLGEGA